MEIQGRIIEKLQIKSGTSSAGKAWSFQEFVIETFSQYPKKVCLQGNTTIVEPLKIGDIVKCQIDPESREYNGKWYTQIRTFKVELDSIQQMPDNNNAPSTPVGEPIQLAQMTESSDVLPF